MKDMIIKRKFKCTGCGEDRPCHIETNQEKDAISFYDNSEDLKCILDETNETSYNWVEVTSKYSDSRADICKRNDHWKDCVTWIDENKCIKSCDLHK